MNVAYPNLTAEIAKRGIKKNAISKQLNISEKTLYNKLCGKVPFTWPEVCTITSCFFPDMEPFDLFSLADDPRTGV